MNTNKLQEHINQVEDWINGNIDKLPFSDEKKNKIKEFIDSFVRGI